MIADYHLHTPLCRHAEGLPSAFAGQAVALGLPEIGFSDHSPMAQTFDDWRMLHEELPRYFEIVADARTAHPELTIRLGLEVDYLDGHEPWIAKLAGMAEWDYFIGGVHYITPDWDVDNPKWLGSGRWEQQPIDEVWRMYFAACERAIRSRLFDFHAHPDLVKKFGHRPGGDLRRFYDPVIQAAVDTGAVFEINTAGLRNSVGEQYPGAEFLRLQREAGVPIVISSDAHKPEDVGRDFPVAHRLAWELGWRESVRFEKRAATTVPLPAPTPVT
ncbi:MAG: histidinol-phosphatase HisJ family protein [Verrucomicrobiales bacterium]